NPRSIRPAAGPAAARGTCGTPLERSRANPLPAALLAWPGGRVGLCAYARVGSPIQETPAELHCPQRPRLLVATLARGRSLSRPPDRLSRSFGGLQGCLLDTADASGFRRSGNLRRTHVGAAHAPDFRDGVEREVDGRVGFPDGFFVPPGHEAERFAFAEVHV